MLGLTRSRESDCLNIDILHNHVFGRIWDVFNVKRVTRVTLKKRFKPRVSYFYSFNERHERGVVFKQKRQNVKLVKVTKIKIFVYLEQIVSIKGRDCCKEEEEEKSRNSLE